MSNLNREIISITKLRRDGRKADEARKTNVRLGAVDGADGSVYFEQGENKILAHINGPKVPSNKGGSRSQKASLTCSYTVAPFARTGYAVNIHDRQQSSESHNTRNFSKRNTAASAARSEINIFVQVLQADGGELCSALNAVSLALIHAGVPCTTLLPQLQGTMRVIF